MQTQYNMTPLPVEGEMEFDNTALPELTEMSQRPEDRHWIENEGPSDAVEAPCSLVQRAEQTILRKRKLAHSDDGAYGDNPAYCNLLHTERQKLAAAPLKISRNTYSGSLSSHIFDIFGVTSLSNLRYRILLLISLTPLPRPASTSTQSMVHLSKSSSPCRVLPKAYLPKRILRLIRWLHCGSQLCFIKQNC